MGSAYALRARIHSTSAALTARVLALCGLGNRGHVSRRYATLRPARLRAYGAAYRDYLLEPSRVTPDLLRVQVEPTLRCNLDCPMCNGEQRRRTRRDMSLSAFRYLLSEFPHLRNLILQGVGEPFLNRDFFGMVALARQRGVFVQTFTNGTLLEEGRVLDGIVGSGLDVLNISFDSADKNVFERMRKGASYERVVAGIESLVGRLRAERSSTQVWLWAVRTRESEDGLADTIRFARRIGVDNVALQPEHGWGIPGRASGPGRGAAWASPLQAVAAEEGIHLKVYAREGPGRTCKWPWYSAYITVEGHVTPCCLQGSDPRRIRFGNLYERPFASIWNGGAYRLFREEMKSPVPPRVCVGCPFY